MRCPKCGFISFDHLEECLKCKKSILAKSENMQGTVLNIAAPAFLALPTDQEEELFEKNDYIADQSGENEEYLDEDLEILAIDDEPEIIDEIELAEDESVESEVLLESKLGFAEKEALEEMEEEHDGEIEIDLGLFENATDPKPALFDEIEAGDTVVPEPDKTIEVPGELSEISDLAAPTLDVDAEGGFSELAVNSDFPDLELGDLNFELGLEDLNDNPATGNGMEVESESVLVLDDFDFSDSSAGEGLEAVNSEGDMKMDEDLNFDLDLGGLSIHDEL